MTARCITIDADPAACAAGLAMLTELRRAGRDGLSGAIDALASIVGKGEAKKKLRVWRDVPTHLATDYADPALFGFGTPRETYCGMTVNIDSMNKAPSTARMSA